jgi:hypothetical protein
MHDAVLLKQYVVYNSPSDFPGKYVVQVRAGRLTLRVI